MRRLGLLLLALAAVAAGCGGAEDDTVTIYLEQRLGPEGPPGQVRPVLMPVERERRRAMSAARAALLALREGPSPDERAHGFLDTFPAGTWPRAVVVRGGTATVELAGGTAPDLAGAAAAVYSLTGLPGVERVRLRFGGRACCVFRHDGSAVSVLTRGSFRGWPGVPCPLRVELHCRGERRDAR